MKNFIVLFAIVFTALTSRADILKTASLNLEGWSDGSNTRAVKLNQMLESQGWMKDVSFLMVQESIEYKGYSTTSQVAAALGWRSFSQPRTSDSEGLGFIYPLETQINSIEVYQIQARESETDYARMALSAQVKHKTLGNIRYVNLHLAHLPNMGATRKNQIAEVLTWLRAIEAKNPSHLIIFGGDFNTGVNETFYANEFDLLTQSKFQFQRSPSEGSSYSWMEETKNGLEKALIDYFFAASQTSQLKLQSFKTHIYPQTIEQGISDHGLLVMTLETRR